MKIAQLIKYTIYKQISPVILTKITTLTILTKTTTLTTFTKNNYTN